MENSNRIQINGVWYVREAEATQPDEVKTVNWMIKRLQDLAEQGYGDCEMTFELDYGGDYTTIGDIEPVRDWDGVTVNRVHIS